MAPGASDDEVDKRSRDPPASEDERPLEATLLRDPLVLPDQKAKRDLLRVADVDAGDEALGAAAAEAVAAMSGCEGVLD